MGIDRTIATALAGRPGGGAVNDLSSRVERLSPAKKDLLLARLKDRLGEAPDGSPDDHSSGTGLPEIRRRTDPGPAPVSFSQQSMLVDGDGVRAMDCVISAAVELVGPLDAGALERALAEIQRRHQALRTTFAHDGERFVQIVHDEGRVALQRDDLTHLPDEERDAEAARRATEDADRPFDVAAGPPWRAMLLRLGDERHVVRFAIHHLVCDGWSAKILIGELAALYEAFAAGRPSPLPDLALQYADYAAWQHRCVSGGAFDVHAEFWRRKLEGADGSMGIELPSLGDGGPLVVCCSNEGVGASTSLPPGAVHELVLPGELRAALATLSRKAGVTLFTTLLSAFKILLRRYSGGEDVLVGTTTANRSSAAIEGLIGFFSNLIVLRTDLAGDPTIGELLQRVQNTVTEAIAHQEYPYALLVQDVQRREDSLKPLFAALFVLLPRLPELELAGLEARRVPISSGRAMYNLMLSFEDGPELRGNFEYNAQVLYSETVAEMAAGLEALLRGMAAGENGRLSSLSTSAECAPGRDPSGELSRRERRIAELVARAVLGLVDRLPAERPGRTVAGAGRSGFQ